MECVRYESYKGVSLYFSTTGTIGCIGRALTEGVNLCKPAFPTRRYTSFDICFATFIVILLMIISHHMTSINNNIVAYMHGGFVVITVSILYYCQRSSDCTLLYQRVTLLPSPYQLL
jgi:hypothetical protein